jgi:hypothetical protein
MVISWALFATVCGVTIALLLGFRINHSSRKDTDAAIIRNKRVIAEVYTILRRMENVATGQSDLVGDSRGNQRLLPGAGCPPVDTPGKG